MRWLNLFFLSLLLLGSCTTEEKISTGLSRFVTDDAIFALEIKNLGVVKDSLSNNDFLARIGKTPAYQEIKKHLALLNYIQQDAPGLLIFSKTEKDSLAFIYITDYTLDLFIEDSLSPTKAEIIPVEDEGITRYEFGNTQLFTRVIDSDIVLGSSLEILLNNGTLPERNDPNEAFEKLYQTSDKSKAITLYINPKEKDQLLTALFEDMPGLDINALNNWTTFDIQGGKNKLTFSGVSSLTDSLPSTLSLFKNTVPTQNMTPTFAPMQTDGLISYTFGDYAEFAKNQQDYLNLENPIDSLFNTVEEIGFIYLNSEKAILLNTFGPENIADFLVSIRKNSTDYQGNIILELSDSDFLNKAFQPIVSNFKANYSTILENAFIFSKTRGLLQTIISDYKKENTYLKSPNYKTAMKNAADAASIILISDGDHIKEVLKNETGKDVNLSKEKIGDYSIVSQIVADGSLFHSNVTAQRKESELEPLVEHPNLKFELEQPLASDPQFVVNHLNKKREIVVQDINNVLYLFSADGKTLWKKQLKGKIQGAIKQVDIFKNGRLQMAFTTSNELLVLDRNGKNVTLFDKNYPGETLNPLAVFDYDNKREYRFVVTQKDKVFMYDRKGKIVSGFKYTKAEARILETPQHMVIENKDYLTFLLEGGIFKALNRKGEVRVKAKEKIEFSKNAIRLHKNMFTITDKKGRLCQIDVEGNVKRITLNLKEYHKMDANSKVFVCMNDNVLSINGKKTELELGAYTQPNIIEMGINSYISVTDLQNQKVYLFDSNSKLLPNFPLYGKSKIDLGDIDGDGKLELITADSENSLVVYKLN